MRILLDENFPLQLHTQLKESGLEVEHIILLGRRGMPDAAIMERLRSEDDLVFLTQDVEFLGRTFATARAIVSRVPQSIPIERRVQIWLRALTAFLESTPEGSVFELDADGHIHRWQHS